jgi:hypothetical protein
MTSEFPPNSQRPQRALPEKAEVKKVEQVVQGEVVRRKKPLSKRLSEIFMGQSPRNALEFVTLDVLIPAAKDTIADAFSQGIERMIFGDSRSPSRRAGGYRPSSPTGHISYNRFASGPATGGSFRPRDEPRTPMSRRGRATHNFDEIILPSRVEADEVIDNLFILLEKYEVVTVGDLYDLLGVDRAFTDEKWGWRNLQGAGVTRVRSGGYLLDLPTPELVE